jgi:hypothetical protein
MANSFDTFTKNYLQVSRLWLWIFIDIVFATPTAMFHVKMDGWMDWTIDQLINQMQNLYEKRKSKFGFGQAGGTLQEKWWLYCRKCGKIVMSDVILVI